MNPLQLQDPPHTDLIINELRTGQKLHYGFIKACYDTGQNSESKDLATCGFEKKIPNTLKFAEA